jgi:hypothetical protein
MSGLQQKKNKYTGVDLQLKLSHETWETILMGMRLIGSLNVF